VGEINITNFFVKLLEHVTFVDTPGVLSGEKQRTQRSYDFTELIASSSSFNDKPLRETVAGPLGMELSQKEQDDLLSDLNDIPKKACDRRVRTHIPIYIQ
jgi:hypothetical protein